MAARMRDSQEKVYLAMLIFEAFFTVYLFNCIDRCYFCDIQSNHGIWHIKGDFFVPTNPIKSVKIILWHSEWKYIGRSNLLKVNLRPFLFLRGVGQFASN